MYHSFSSLAIAPERPSISCPVHCSARTLAPGRVSSFPITSFSFLSFPFFTPDVSFAPFSLPRDLLACSSLTPGLRRACLFHCRVDGRVGHLKFIIALLFDRSSSSGTFVTGPIHSFFPLLRYCVSRDTQNLLVTVSQLPRLEHVCSLRLHLIRLPRYICKAARHRST